MKKEKSRLLIYSLFQISTLLPILNGCVVPLKIAKEPIGVTIDYSQIYRNNLSGDSYHVT